jgi:hypothetical protein|tara:strand:- start:1485 stop:1616 length:132 start_codon:yes stop_codon:yes gene_type:complete
MPEEITLVIGSITIYLIGIVTGMYAASQIEKDINKRITKNKQK